MTVVKLLDRHELYGVYAEVLEIIHLLHDTFEISLFGEITDQKFIYDQVILVLNAETALISRDIHPGVLPVEIISLKFERRDHSVSLGRV